MDDDTRPRHDDEVLDAELVDEDGQVSRLDTLLSSAVAGAGRSRGRRGAAAGSARPA